MATDPADRLSEVWRVARTKRRPIIDVVLFVTLLSALYSLILPLKWTATASFFPERRASTDLTSGLGSLSGLGGLVGAVGGSINLGQTSAQFFAEMAKSRSFLDSLAQSSVVTDSFGTIEKVANYLVPRARDAATRRWKARTAVKRALRVTTTQVGVVVIAATCKSPYAAAALANRALEVLDALNIAFRRREAAARRRFNQVYLDDVQTRLSEAEDRLVQFLTTNRVIATPAMQRTQEALQVEVERLRALKQQLETSVENARLAEYNDAPVVATVDAASVPERKSGPPRRLIVVGAFLMSLLGVFWALYLRLWT